MSTTLSRRAVLQIAGGSALGILFSPLPWKLLDDTSIWTQNWPWIPKGQRGTISYAGATCTLCQAACGMRTRSVGTQPIGLSGMPQHPFNDGAICTMGMLAHHLRYHPARVKQPVKCSPSAEQGTPISSPTVWDEISRIMKSSPAAGSVAVIDSRPGRTASSILRRICADNAAATYVAAAAPALDVLHAMTDVPMGPIGYDIDRARTILNFGAPLFDTWGTPSRAAKLFASRASKAQTIIHVEGMCSRSAERADQWIAARPGSESLLALGIANVIIEEKLFSPAAARSIADFAAFSTFVRTFTPESVSKAAGVTPETIRSTARAFALQSPAIAIIGSEASHDARSAVMALNVLAGTIGRTGGVSVRNDIPDAPAFAVARAHTVSMENVPDHSIRVLVLDESLSGCMVPDALLEKKLVVKDAVVISLSPFVTARPFCTQYVIPASVTFETLTDVPGPIDTAAGSLSIATAVLQAPEGSMDALQFALALARAMGSPTDFSGTTEELLKQRCAAIHAAKRGTVFVPSTGAATEMNAIASADELWSAMAEGGCWMDDMPRTAAPAASFTVMKAFSGSTIGLPKSHGMDQVVVLPFAEMNVYQGALISPLLNKVSQESGLRLGLRQAYVNPATAQTFSIVDGETIALTTEHGSMNVRAKVDASVMPDVIFVSTAGSGGHGRSAQPVSDVRILCDLNGSGSFSPTPVSIQKVLA